MKIDTFFATFDQLSDAPEACDIMRDLILRLAVRGKLAERHPGDDSVNELIEGLTAAKFRCSHGTMIEARSSDRTKGPIDIPPHWAWVALDDIGALSGGMTPSKAISSYWDGSVNWFTSKDIKTDELRESGLKITTEAVESTGLQLYPPGCLFMVARSGILKRTFPVAINRVPSTVNQDLKVLTPYISGLAEYLQIMFRGLNDFIIRSLVKTGMTVQSLKYEEFEEQPFPLPPLAEQRRIVARVRELMALCGRLERQQAERKARQAELARVSVARFADEPTPKNLTLLFHSSFEIAPADLRETILELAVQGKLVPRDGVAPCGTLESILVEASFNGVSKGPTLDTTGTEILRISAGTSREDFFVDEDDFKHVMLSPEEIMKFRLAGNDLLACRFNGNLHYVGRFSLYRGESGRIQVNPDKLIRFRVNTERYSPRYVCYAMNAPHARAVIESMCATTAGNIGLSAGRLKTVEIPLPPLDEQLQIVAKITRMMALVDRLAVLLPASREQGKYLLESIVAEMGL